MARFDELRSMLEPGEGAEAAVEASAEASRRKKK